MLKLALSEGNKFELILTCSIFPHLIRRVGLFGHIKQ